MPESRKNIYTKIYRKVTSSFESLRKLFKTDSLHLECRKPYSEIMYMDVDDDETIYIVWKNGWIQRLPDVLKFGAKNSSPKQILGPYQPVEVIDVCINRADVGDLSKGIYLLFRPANVNPGSSRSKIACVDFALNVKSVKESEVPDPVKFEVKGDAFFFIQCDHGNAVLSYGKKKRTLQGCSEIIDFAVRTNSVFVAGKVKPGQAADGGNDISDFVIEESDQYALWQHPLGPGKGVLLDQKEQPFSIFRFPGDNRIWIFTAENSLDGISYKVIGKATGHRKEDEKKGFSMEIDEQIPGLADCIVAGGRKALYFLSENNDGSLTLSWIGRIKMMF